MYVLKQKKSFNIIFILQSKSNQDQGFGGRDRMVVGFTTTCAMKWLSPLKLSSNPVNGELYSIQHYVIKFVSDLWQVSCFPQQ